jgi:prepilin-type N-terminal cleavage/methylation domain-containing protein
MRRRSQRSEVRGQKSGIRSLKSDVCGLKSGMTLIEVLLALAILTVAAGVLMTATSRCLAVVRTAKNYYEARRILEIGELEYPLLLVQKKNEKELKPLNLTVGPVEYPQGFSYQRTSERNSVKEDLIVIHNRVTWSAKGHDAFEEVTSYFYYTNDLTGL